MIWGIIIYQVVDAFSPKETNMASIPAIKQMNLQVSEREKFTISMGTRDPFLGTLNIPKPAKKKIPKPVKKRQETLSWPSIHYEGMVTGQGKSPAIYILNIDGNSVLLKIKQKAGEILLWKGNAKKVILKFKGATKTVQISK